LVENFEAIENGASWIYVKFENANYKSHKNAESVLNNPWVLAIFRNTVETPNLDGSSYLFTIFPDWRINTLNQNNFSVQYSYYKDYVVLELYDSVYKRMVANVLYKINWEYIIK
jgi:hypothetical protein